MKINDLVKIRITKRRRFAIGLLTEVNMRQRQGVVYRNGVRYVRDLKRIYPLKEKQRCRPSA